MADAFAQGFGNSTSPREHGITFIVPKIPLFIPDQAQQIIFNLIRTTVRLALMEVAGRVSDEAAKFADTGHLSQSFGADPATATGGIELTGVKGADVVGRVFSSLPYAIVMEWGRRPGQPISRLGIDAIGLWAQRKLGLSADKADSAKWAIANKIVAQGIEGQHYFEDGVNRARPKVEGMFNILGQQLAQALVGLASGQTGTA